MNKLIKFILFAFLISMLSACSMKSMMIEERVSPFGMQETVDKIVANAQAIGWSSPGVRNMNKSIHKHGGPDIGAPVRIVELCNAGHASTILLEDEGKYASVLMPCAIAVYQKADGQTYVANMRAGLMGSMMGGVVSEVMQEVDVDQKKILEFLD